MKKIIMFFSLLFMSHVFAAPLSKVIFFGDSLSDNGNVYKLFLKTIPKSPPYFKGRFTNGPTWAEYVGKYYYDKYYIDFDIYAYGGATAIYHNPTPKFAAPKTLTQEVNDYLTDTLGEDKSQTLYSILIGGNDYLFDQNDNADELTTKVTGKIISQMQRLMNEGAKNFVVFNLPDLSKTPFADTNGFNDKLYTLSVMHNTKLADEINNLKLKNPNVKIVFVDIFSFMTDVIHDPAKYNNRFHVNITNTVDACWQGGFTYKSLALEQKLRADLERQYAKENITNNKHEEIQAKVDYVMNSPELRYVYSLNEAFEQGMRPCTNANERIFWDKIHPTAIVHQVLAKIVLEELNKDFG